MIRSDSVKQKPMLCRILILNPVQVTPIPSSTIFLIWYLLRLEM